MNIKESILKITPYQPGKSHSQGKDNIIKLSSNENPLGCSTKVIDELKNINLLKLNRYPDGSALDLRSNLAKFYNIKKDNIICGAGSDEVIGLLMSAFTKECDEIIYTEYGFLMYKIYALANGVVPIVAKETNYRVDIKEILKKVTAKTRIVFIANPNNPTGSYISGDDLTKLREELDNDIILVLDEAYAEYVDNDDYPLGFNFVEKYDNIVATRTFSKIYGLASVRIGYCYASPAIADVLNRVRSPFNTSYVSQKLASAALSDQGFVKKSKKHNKKWLKLFEEEFAKYNFVTLPSVANFILIDFENEKKAQKFYNFFLKKGIIFRNVVEYGLPDKIRITIGTETENQKIFMLLEEFFSC